MPPSTRRAQVALSLVACGLFATACGAPSSPPGMAGGRSGGPAAKPAANGAAVSPPPGPDGGSAPTAPTAPAEPAAPQAPPAADCTVDPSREVMLTGLSVVEDPIRTAEGGAWSFAHLMAQAAGHGDAEAFVRSWLNIWTVKQVLNGFSIPARAAGIARIVQSWPTTAEGKLDLNRAPMRLLAISNRLDLRLPAQGSAGELRFIFGVVDGTGAPILFTAIFEFNMPITGGRDALAWARLWHALGDRTLTPAAYNQTLQAITDLVTAANAAPGQPNGSALLRIRTNEIALDTFNSPPQWELRQFEIGGDGLWHQAPVGLTPDLSLNKTAAFADFVNQNTATILAGSLAVPTTFAGAPFLGAASPNLPIKLISPLQPPILRDPNETAAELPPQVSQWTAAGIVNNDARAIVSLNTCNGCHGVETQTPFLHVANRAAGQPAALSGFLTGQSVSDPVDPSVERTYDDLQRRATEMANVLCHGAGTAPGGGVEARPQGL